MHIHDLPDGTTDTSVVDEQKVHIRRNDPIEVISLDGDDDEANDIIEEEDIEELIDNKTSSENDSQVMEVISLVDDEEDEGSSSDENEETPIGTAKLSFLDAENKKIHKFIKITNAENDYEMIDIEGISSDSDVEEVIEKDNEKRIYITIDPDDYKKVMKEKPNPEGYKKLRRKNKSMPEDFIKLKKGRPGDSAKNINFQGLEVLDNSLNIDKCDESPESPDSLKGPDIPKAICCHSCSYVCFKEDELVFHISVKHPTKAESLRTYTAAEIQELEREMRDQADDCSSCSQALWYLPTLRAHAMIHPAGKVGCEACHHGTSVIKLLMDHLESHVGSEEEEDSDM